MKLLLCLMTLLMLPWTGYSLENKLDTHCGIYEFDGYARKVKGAMVVKVFEGSASETILSLDAELEEALRSFKGKAITIRAELREPIRKFRGKLFSTKTLEEQKAMRAENKPLIALSQRDDIFGRVEDPISADRDGDLRLILKKECLIY